MLKKNPKFCEILWVFFFKKDQFDFADVLILVFKLFRFLFNSRITNED